MRFTKSFSVEADGLFRQLTFRNEPGDRQGTITWEFPILAKYRFASVGVGRTGFRPFVEAGPAFRTAGYNSSDPSHNGFTAGAGLDFHLGKVGIAPTVRYTRWAEDAKVYNAPETKPDQVELLVGLSYDGTDLVGLHRRRIRIGAVIGTNLLADYKGYYEGGILSASDMNSTIAFYTYSYYAGPKSVSAGPTIEIH